MGSEMKIDTETGVMSARFPKEVAKFTICGAFTLVVTDMMAFTPPTEEQRKNLKEMLCIDVELLEYSKSSLKSILSHFNLTPYISS